MLISAISQTKKGKHCMITLYVVSNKSGTHRKTMIEVTRGGKLGGGLEKMGKGGKKVQTLSYKIKVLLCVCNVQHCDCYLTIMYYIFEDSKKVNIVALFGFLIHVCVQRNTEAVQPLQPHGPFSRQEYWNRQLIFSRGSSSPRGLSWVSCIAGGFQPELPI